MIDLTEIIIAVLTLVFGLISANLIPYLKSKCNKEQLQTLVIWTKIAVEAAEMIYKDAFMGEEKKQYVIDFLKSKGMKVNITEIENLIEAAVHDMQKEKSLT